VGLLHRRVKQATIGCTPSTKASRQWKGSTRGRGGSSFMNSTRELGFDGGKRGRCRGMFGMASVDEKSQLLSDFE
jgi:hypothetical protein